MDSLKRHLALLADPDGFPLDDWCYERWYSAEEEEAARKRMDVANKELRIEQVDRLGKDEDDTSNAK